jgi:hypothetical protein
MESIQNKNSLEMIEDLKKRLRRKALVITYCWVTNEKNYVYSFENLNAIFEKYLKKVEAITKEQGFPNDIYLKFKHETAKILHYAAMERQEYRWVIYYKNNYGF